MSDEIKNERTESDEQNSQLADEELEVASGGAGFVRFDIGGNEVTDPDWKEAWEDIPVAGPTPKHPIND